MTLVRAAAWIVERNLSEPLSLAAIADACGVSRFHLSHAFAAATGLTVMQYLRGRRLTEAARRLAAGRDNILDLALETGYGSHEAFSRAFKQQFAITPEAARLQACADGPAGLHPLDMTKRPVMTLAEPRFVVSNPMLLVGLQQRHNLSALQAIPGQWNRFRGVVETIRHLRPGMPMGVSLNMDEDGGFDYLCVAEVSQFGTLPEGMTSLRLPATGYAVFTHADHIASLGATYEAIWDSWFPAHDVQPREGAVLEKHLPAFDPRTGLGGVEIWVPVTEPIG